MIIDFAVICGIPKCIYAFGLMAAGTVEIFVALTITATVVIFLLSLNFFKPPPPVGAGGGYMFSGRPSVPLSVRPSVIHVVVLCFRDISSIC